MIFFSSNKFFFSFLLPFDRFKVGIFCGTWLNYFALVFIR